VPNSEVGTEIGDNVGANTDADEIEETAALMYRLHLPIFILMKEVGVISFYCFIKLFV